MLSLFSSKTKRRYSLSRKLERIRETCASFEDMDLPSIGNACSVNEQDGKIGDTQLDRNGNRGQTQTSDVTDKAGQTETKAATDTRDRAMGEVCLMTESPYRILKVAASGNVKEFEKLYTKDNSRLHIQDSKGWAPIHHASAKGRVKIIDLIVQYGGDLNIRDNAGNTAVHTAVESGKSESLHSLIIHGAVTDIHNENNMAPIHLAVDTGNADILEALLSHSNKVDVSLRGELGQTALHHAAAKNQSECAQRLLEYGASLCIACEIGYYPIHIAATSGSAKTLEVLVAHAKKQDLDVLQYKDKDNNMPLHAAVNSGSEQAVRVCLQAGADIIAVQHDKSTPVHLACSQGLLGMVKLMLDLQADKKFDALCACDAMLMTPMHTAAMFDHTEIVDYLISEGAEINCKDREDRTPLLIAAARMGWRTVCVLLKAGADVNIKDKSRRNFLHLAILNGARIEDLDLDIIKIMTWFHGDKHRGNAEVFDSVKPSHSMPTMTDNEERKDMLNEKDESGCTSLHYASREGHLHALEGLMRLGAYLDIKNNEKQSPLHFAARYGRINSCKRMLDSAEGPQIINEADGEGLTSLHVASEAGKAKVVKLLLQRGALLHRDYRGNTPLHLAAQNGYTQSMSMLLSVHAHILDAVNKDGDTALHLAAREGHARATTLLLSMKASFTQNYLGTHFFADAIENRHKDVAMATISHDRWRETMNLRSGSGGASPILLLIEHLPEVCMAVLDRCKTTSSLDCKSKGFYYHYDFQYLQCPMWWISERKRKNEEFVPMIALNTMVKFNRVDCLSHPVCVHFLEMKWNAYGRWFHWANIIIYMIFLVFLTTFVSTSDPLYHTDKGYYFNRHNNTYHHVNEAVQREMFQRPYYECIHLYGMTAFCAISLFKEVLQMLQQKMKYFGDLTNLLEWTLYVTTGVFVTPALFGFSTHWQWQCGAVAVFLAWFNLLLYLQRFDTFGIYVVMFLGILKTLLLVILVFSILIVAFGLSFYILLSGQRNMAHSSPLLSLVRVFIMMLGEIDYISSFMDHMATGDTKGLHFPYLTYTLLIVFVLLMPILLMNLLIGLAVGDIESVQKNAKLKRLAMQVELHTDLEKKLPQRILEYVDKTESIVHPNHAQNLLSRIWSKIRCNNDDDDNDHSFGVHGADSWHNSHVAQELGKQKQRLKEISNNLDKQNELLKLIVEKMEIRSEALEKDEGSSMAVASSHVKKVGRWASVKLRAALPRQATVVSAFKIPKNLNV